MGQQKIKAAGEYANVPIEQVYQQFTAEDWEKLADLSKNCPNPALKVRLQQRYQQRY